MERKSRLQVKKDIVDMEAERNIPYTTAMEMADSSHLRLLNNTTSEFDDRVNSDVLDYKLKDDYILGSEEDNNVKNFSATSVSKSSNSNSTVLIRERKENNTNNNNNNNNNSNNNNNNNNNIPYDYEEDNVISKKRNIDSIRRELSDRRINYEIDISDDTDSSSRFLE